MRAYDTGFNCVKLTNGYVIIEDRALRGWRIGSYCFNLLVRWAKYHCPESDVATIKLLATDATEEVNRTRRNMFYEQFGIRFAYTDMDGLRNAAGESEPMKARELVERSRDEFSNIEELDMPHAAAFSALLFPQAQRRVLELRQSVTEMVRQTLPTRRFLGFLKYMNWLSFWLAALLGAMAMSAWQRWS
ncbi:hypothetical protein OR16_04772 [Cupriavidus basilensis OR16]|uniref:Uncharacterized protein n=1 Tax=Cupriavidus basilensis OR16 TaxID=1127483 RepID=H1S046_9BURK|nr:hypothetical protein [Cupriavidus basilensis]EHP44262.1 hypothetical protein OR16_04772 [Cupriavidus basilensis OR16]